MIHHYTSVRSLSAILISRRLRFTRLDRFDDVLEAQSLAGINFGSQLFASCWVKNEEEDIAQWSMYGDSMRGVRITFQDDPFEWHVLNVEHQVPGTNAKWKFDNVEAPFTLDELFGNGYLLQPIVGGRATFLKEVVYVPDVASEYRRRIRQDGSTTVISGQPMDLAQFKWDRWRFQREHRFVLAAMLGPKHTSDREEYGSNYYKHVSNPEWHKLGVEAPNIDLKISASALDNFLITTGPLMSEEHKREVRSLLSRLAPRAVMRLSDLEGKIRSP